MFELRMATLADVPLLAQMNAQLNLDIHSPNTMSLEALEERMLGWLSADREAVMVIREERCIGYLLYRRGVDEYYPYGEHISVRQYFIEASSRRLGLGKLAFQRIVKEILSPDTPLLLEVLHSSPESLEFWHKLGFHTYFTTLRRDSGNGARPD